jgi:hypothetical protein
MSNVDRTAKSGSQSIGIWLTGGLVTALCLGAAYLYTVRGTALLLDLAAAAGGLFCY